MEDHRLYKTVDELIDKTNIQSKMLIDLVELVGSLVGRIYILENKIKERE